MNTETVVQHLPGNVPNERILLCLSQRDGRWRIAMRQQHWAEGIGWYDQKVLHFDARQWSALREMLSGQMAGLPEIVDEPPRTLPFPGPANRPSRVRRVAEQA